MPENRTYKEVLAGVETSLTFINNHLGNIDQHLNKLNDRTTHNEIDIATNKADTGNNRGLIYKMGIPVCIAIMGCGTTLILKLVGAF